MQTETTVTRLHVANLTHTQAPVCWFGHRRCAVVTDDRVVCDGLALVSTYALAALSLSLCVTATRERGEL